jgi:hypothetical protein
MADRVGRPWVTRQQSGLAAAAAEILFPPLSRAHHRPMARRSSYAPELGGQVAVDLEASADFDEGRVVQRMIAILPIRLLCPQTRRF